MRRPVAILHAVVLNAALAAGLHAALAAGLLFRRYGFLVLGVD